MVAGAMTLGSRVKVSAERSMKPRCGLDPAARLDADPGLLVVDAFERAARADLLHERAGVIRQRRLHALPACGRGLAEPSAQRIESLAFERGREHGRRKLGRERFAESLAFL